MDLKDFEQVLAGEKKISDAQLRRYLHDRLATFPVPKVRVNKNTYIERAVRVSHFKESFGLGRLSYIPKELEHKVNEGRFNRQGERIFYAAFTDLEEPESTRYFLATELDHALLGEQQVRYPITLTKWLSTESFESIYFVFKEEYCTNDLTENARRNLLTSQFNGLSEEDLSFLGLITDEIANPDSPNGYAITNHVFDFYKDQGFKAIIYPGVRSRYRGNNIAMLPEVVDDCWQCDFGAEFVIRQEGMNLEIEAVDMFSVSGDTLFYRSIKEDEIGPETTIEK